MSSATLPPLPPPPPLVAQPTEYENFIDQRLRQTRRQVKVVDIAGGMATLAIGALGYLFVVALADHWLFVGGLATWARWLLWLGFIGATGAFVFFRLLPPMIRRVNPVFAALTIESSRPTLRNSLINFLLLRGRRQELAAPIYNTIEHRAAADLTNVRVETAVDRASLIRLCQVLAAVLAVYLIYLVVSPKNPLNTAGRVLFPWTNIEAATRVTIGPVRPGDTPAFHGEFLTVSAEIAGLRDDETPALIYSTADGQVSKQSIPMTRPEGELRHQCILPPGKTGLQQTYRYHIAAGDARTREYTIEVRQAPAIVVDSVVYDYPGYTGIADRTETAGGDLRAIEGTEVTIHALANTEIKPDTAEIDLGSTGRRGLPMSSSGLKATGRFRLQLNPDDENSPLYDSYLLRFTDSQGRENPHPVRHRIEVVRDLPPDVEIVEPREPEVRVAENGRAAIRVQAKDPDFALRRVEIRAVRGDNRSLALPALLDRRRPAEPVAGEYQGEFVFEPVRFGLKAGDRVQYWAAAEDNKEPSPNLTESEKRWIVVDNPLPQDQQPRGNEGDPRDQPKDRRPDQQQNGNQQTPDEQTDDQPQDPAEDRQSGDGEQKGDQEKQQSGDGEQKGDQEKQQSGDGEQKGDQEKQQSGDGEQNGKQETQQSGKGDQSGEQNQRIDPEAEPGDAFQEIIKDQQQQEQQAAEDTSQNGKQQQGGEQSYSESAERKGEQQSAPGRQGGEKNKTAQPKPGEQNLTGDKSTPKEDGKKKPADKSPSDQAEGTPDGKGGKTDAEKQPDADSPPSGDVKDGVEKEPGGKTDETPRDGKGADDKTGEQQQPHNEDQAAGDEPSGDKRTGQRDMPGDKEEHPADPGGAAPDEEGKPNDKQRPDKAGDAPGERKDQETPAPADGKKESDAQSDTSGDRAGEGEKGGGQQSNQPGVGGPGSNTPADEGASQADERGQGETGSKAGDREASSDPTGSEKKAVKPGQAPPGEQQDETAPGGSAPPGKQSDSKEPSTQKQPPKTDDTSGIATDQDGAGSKEGVSGKATGGGKPGTSSTTDTDAPTDSAADSANLDYARRQTELALEHLRDQLAKEQPELLDKLGWTKDDARRFLDRWERMRRAAEQQGPQGEQAKRQFNEALKSLGLGRGTELKHGGVETDRPETQRDAGRTAPPPDWADHLRAYTRGVAGEGAKKEKQ